MEELGEPRHSVRVCELSGPLTATALLGLELEWPADATFGAPSDLGGVRVNLELGRVR